ncbi:maestro heat-like repeat-containing protein family member 1 isoform x3 [Limosa lapponica baueri]|uniref:Maestro heat-like repeat-containing protein family member 1 isoform x3 n=1 Tax=Limosa lapponica baueri TaxID=1758121 RepID=A0A2I0T2J1_LIMLA|nr:maestro heat-like repeat-containing protein family member 1 isoform x3 [Limosa lapponica baueri]
MVAVVALGCSLSWKIPDFVLAGSSLGWAGAFQIAQQFPWGVVHAGLGQKRVPFLQETLAAVADNAWICHFVTEMCRQLSSYNGLPLEKGLASCFGICAINHLEETLAKLEDFVRSDVFKKSVGLFSLFKHGS